MILKVQLWFFVCLLSVCLSVAAQKAEDGAAIDTEIICFAAKNRWVCAPADDQQKAHNKAMRLSQSSADESLGDDNNIQISTLNDNPDFDQIVEEEISSDSPISNLPTAVSEFEVSKSSTPETQAKTPEPIKTIEANETVLSSVNPTAPETIDGINGFIQSGKAEFDSWQVNHPGKWSFQVIGTSNQHHLDGFIKQHGLHNGAYSIAKTTVKGADWWVVLVGLYDTREQAINQRNRLPVALAGQAWVRQINAIK